MTSRSCTPFLSLHRLLELRGAIYHPPLLKLRQGTSVMRDGDTLTPEKVGERMSDFSRVET
jgi:hypothetical protein